MIEQAHKVLGSPPKSAVLMDYSKFKITGVDRSGKRFCIYTDDLMIAMGINLYCGSVWVNKRYWNAWRDLENEDGDEKRWKLVRRVWN